MLRCIILLRLLPFLLCLLISKDVDAVDATKYWFDGVPVEDLDFSYDDPSKWSNEYYRCGLPEQSPIMLSSKNTTPIDIHMRFESVRDITKLPYKAFLHNTGKGLTAYFGNDEYVMRLNDKSDFRVKEMHFHWPSEHYLNGKRYPLEIQVQFASYYEKEPLRLNKDIHFPNFQVMFSILYEMCWDGRFDYPAAAFHEDFILKVTQPREKTYIALWAPEDITRLSDMQCFIMYMGSQTTPPCSTIPWFVSTIPRCIFDDFPDIEDAVFGYGNRSMKGFSRPLQPLDGRMIYSNGNEKCDDITTIEEENKKKEKGNKKK